MLLVGPGTRQSTGCVPIPTGKMLPVRLLGDALEGEGVASRASTPGWNWLSGLLLIPPIEMLGGMGEVELVVCGNSCFSPSKHCIFSLAVLRTVACPSWLTCVHRDLSLETSADFK